MARFVGAELQDSTGKAIVAVGTDRVIKTQGGFKPMKFNDDDEIEFDGEKMSIGEDGLVRIFNADGTAGEGSSELKFVGFRPAARRAAAVLVIGLMAKVVIL